VPHNVEDVQSVPVAYLYFNFATPVSAENPCCKSTLQVAANVAKWVVMQKHFGGLFRWLMWLGKY